jgi:hypothetical protein
MDCGAKAVARCAFKRIAIFREADSGGKARQTRARKPIKTRIEQRGQNLPRAISAEIEAENAIAILDPGVIANDAGRDEFIGLVGGMGG